MIPFVEKSLFGDFNAYNARSQYCESAVYEWTMCKMYSQEKQFSKVTHLPGKVLKFQQSVVKKIVS